MEEDPVGSATIPGLQLNFITNRDESEAANAGGALVISGAGDDAAGASALIQATLDPMVASTLPSAKQ